VQALAGAHGDPDLRYACLNALVQLAFWGKDRQRMQFLLQELEELAARHTDVESLAAELATKYKDSKIGTKGQLIKRLAPMDRAEQEEARKKLRAVLPREEQLVERLLPFFGIIRLDLRGLPLVIRSGELYVTDSSLRKNTGTHYTPRFLAEEVVEGALEPLVYEPGPLQTADTNEWKLKSSQEILALKVADIAVGSAAFLVAACVLFVAGLTVIAGRFFARYVLPLRRMADETRLVAEANPEHRITVTRPAALGDLAAAVNVLACRRQDVAAEVDARIAAARRAAPPRRRGGLRRRQ
jgi:hypothetical protein